LRSYPNSAPRQPKTGLHARPRGTVASSLFYNPVIPQPSSQAGSTGRPFAPAAIAFRASRGGTKRPGN